MTADALLLPIPFGFARANQQGRRPNEPMDEAKFEVFYRKTAGAVWSYVFRLTGDASLADDLTQKAFFRFVRSNPAVANDEHRRRYVFKTATNLVFDHFREVKKQRQYQIEAPSRTSTPPDRTELRHDMARVFAELKPQDRALLWLAHVEGSSHEEIADTLGLKSKSIKVMLFRARKRLGEMLTAKGLGPGGAR